MRVLLPASLTRLFPGSTAANSEGGLPIISRPSFAQRAGIAPGTSEPPVKSAFGTRVPRFALAGAEPPGVPVSGFTQSTGLSPRGLPSKPGVAS